MRRWLAPAIAAAVAAAFVVALYAVRPVPWVLVRAVGVSSGLELHGGLRVEYRVPPGGVGGHPEVVDRLRERAKRIDPGAKVEQRGDVITIEIPGVSEADAPGLRDALLSTGVQFMAVVDGTPYMRDVYARVQADPNAKALDIDADVDQWRLDDGTNRTDYYVTGPDRMAILRYLDEAGLAPAAGHMLAFELLPGGRRWRSYYVDARVLLDSNDIADATASVDPYANRPIVLLDFTRSAASRFADITERMVGGKLATVLGGRVVQAPIVMSRIVGGRVSITMRGDADAETIEREARELATTLRIGPLPVGGEIVDARYVAPTASGATLWLARALGAAIAGLLAFGVIALVGRGTERVPRTAASPRTPVAPVGRLAVTLAAPVVLVAFGLAESFLDVMPIYAGPGMAGVGPFALGLTPIVTAFVAVELAVAAVPAWRHLRLTAAGRRRLALPIAALAIAVAAMHGYFIGSHVGQLGVLVATFVGATAVLLVVADLLGTYGLANGYSTLIASAFVIDIVWVMLDTPPPSAQLALFVVTLVAVGGATAWLVTRRAPTTTDAPPVAAPVAGLVPLLWSAGALQVVGLLVILGVAFDIAWITWLDWRATAADSVARDLVQVALAAAITAGTGWLWSRPGPAAAAFTRVTGAAASPDPSAFRRALGASIVIVVAIGAAGWALQRAGVPLAMFDVIEIAALTAVILDVVAESRARSAGELVAVWPIHQIGMVETARAVLERAGIAPHFRGRHHRMLYAFFGPFVAIEVMVPPERAAEAAALMRDVFDPAAHARTIAF